MMGGVQEKMDFTGNTEDCEFVTQNPKIHKKIDQNLDHLRTLSDIKVNPPPINKKKS